MTQPKIAVAPQNKNFISRAEQLAERLDLPICRPGQEFPLLLKPGSKGLALVATETNGKKTVVRVDFTTGEAVHRRRQQKREMLVRAVGFREKRPPSIIDATGGLGRDSFLLAAAGCQVEIFERVPVVAALLADGLERAFLEPETTEIARRIKLTCMDSLIRLQTMHESNETTEVVYLDPMFPKRQKSALVKKESQMLQLLAVEDKQPQLLLAAALAATKKRVVVKRPIKSPPLTGPSPSHTLTGKTIRFDVYMIPEK